MQLLVVELKFYCEILEFPSLVSSPDLIGGSHHKKSRIPCVIAREQSDRSNLIKSPSLRGSKATEARNSKIPNLEFLIYNS